VHKNAPRGSARQAAVERQLARESVLVCDDLNYIKGFRCRRPPLVSD
jgi:tRNA uridine 5-carbamoylmethylation protein Kti12